MSDYQPKTVLPFPAECAALPSISDAEIGRLAAEEAKRLTRQAVADYRARRSARFHTDQSADTRESWNWPLLTAIRRALYEQESVIPVTFVTYFEIVAAERRVRQELYPL